MPLQSQYNFSANIDHRILDQLFTKYGPVPRNIYDSCDSDGELTSYDSDTRSAINSATPASIACLVHGINPDISLNLSSKLVCLVREGDGLQRKTTILSKYVLRELLNSATFASLDAKRDLCRQFIGVSAVASEAGMIFEGYAHSVLARSPSNLENSIRFYQLVPTVNNTTYKPISPIPIHSMNSLYPRIDREVHVYYPTTGFINGPPSENYCIPDSINNPGFDSFVCDKGNLYIFQMTMSPTHSIDSENGRKLLEKYFNRDKKGERQWHYILVVPDFLTLDTVRLTSVSEKWKDKAASFGMMVLSL